MENVYILTNYEPLTYTCSVFFLYFGNMAHGVELGNLSAFWFKLGKSRAPNQFVLGGKTMSIQIYWVIYMSIKLSILQKLYSIYDSLLKNVKKIFFFF